MHKLIVSIVAISMILFASQAWAGSTDPPVTWTLSGVTFTDGSTASGFFTDPSGGTVNGQFLTTGWSITTTGDGGAFTGFTYDPTDSTAHLINDTPALFPVSPPLGFYGFALDLTSTATCGSGASFGFCNSLILEADVPTGLVSSASPIALSLLFTVESCSGCGPGGLDENRDITAGDVVASTASNSVPEPSSFLMLGSGLLGLAPLLRRRTYSV
ncbi:MAG TPA: PEP-CTERM sorting domain-containing protein [Candidatus Bathyarchaeia archaeon]|nr:PEP-CTERM sorting domain-containing protein [Candidatus Bathyarchaeia archaeon]